MHGVVGPVLHEVLPVRCLVKDDSVRKESELDAAPRVGNAYIFHLVVLR